MRFLRHLVRAVGSFLLALLLVSTVLRGDWLATLLLALSLIAVATPAGRHRRLPLRYLATPWARIALVVLALAAFVGLVRVSRPDSIYHSETVRETLYRLYDTKMAGWPVPFEDRFITTEYGTVHAVVSGPEGAPALLLLHASGVGSWSWKYNVEALSREYRVYAIDLIGDAGRSEFRNLDTTLRTGRDQADLYAGIADSLGIETSRVAGASEGGFIATNYALHHPERVEKLALIAPMGYSGAVGAIVRIMLTQLFPLQALQESTFAWAFSRSAALQEDFGEWFRLVMSGTTPAKVAPLPFSAEQRRQLEVPVLFIFGERDNLVGDPVRAERLVQDIPSVQVVILDAGHLAAAEKPVETNALLLDFFRR